MHLRGVPYSVLFSTQMGRNFYPNQRDFEEIYHETAFFYLNLSVFEEIYCETAFFLPKLKTK